MQEEILKIIDDAYNDGSIERSAPICNRASDIALLLSTKDCKIKSKDVQCYLREKGYANYHDYRTDMIWKNNDKPIEAGAGESTHRPDLTEDHKYLVGKLKAKHCKTDKL